MYAVGHLALGYLSGKAAGKLLNLEVNLPLLFVASILPDVDLLIPGLQHRGPTHSLIFLTLLCLPLFILYRERALPYFAALTQHALIGDYLTGGAQLLWPLTNQSYGSALEMASLPNIILEWLFFLTSLSVMLKVKDMQILLRPHSSNMLLVVPVATVLLPVLLSIPLIVPIELLVPHLIYVTLFTLPIITDLEHALKKG